MFKYIYILLILCSFNILHAQEATIRNFQAIPQDDYVVLSWTTDSGYTCATLTIFHSIDSINFQQIYLYPGVCGSFEEAQSYSYIHSDPEPDRINYYRLEPTTFNQQLNAGTFFKSSKTFLIYPNPATENAIIYLDNSPVSYQLIVTALNGKVIYEKSDIDENIVINVDAWGIGKYIFQLKIGNQIYIGNFLVQE